MDIEYPSICYIQRWKAYGKATQILLLWILGFGKAGIFRGNLVEPVATWWPANLVQIVGTVIAVIVYLGTTWWMIYTIPNICNTSVLPTNIPWTCPMDRLFYDAFVIWGLIGPIRIFGDLCINESINVFFLVAEFTPLVVWLFHKAFPHK